MPWMERDQMSLREEFVRRALCDGANKAALCREFHISRKTGYKWIGRVQAGGYEALSNRSRRPRHSPRKTVESVESAILAVRAAHPAWGPRKLRAYLLQQGASGLPCTSTIGSILKRCGQIDPQEALKHRAYQSFAMERPNQLWQMDFKGYFRLEAGGHCHPLSVLDDHSRFALGLHACANETHRTVQPIITLIFRKYGLPERMLMDNGAPWGHRQLHPYTALTVWLIRLGIQISHGREYHPETQGKVERFHRTLKLELLSQRVFATLPECQTEFDVWLTMYNQERPHEALGLQPPISSYAASTREFPESLPPIVYATGDQVRKVDVCGRISFGNHVYRVGKAFRHQPVAIRPSGEGTYDVFYCAQRIGSLDVRH